MLQEDCKSVTFSLVPQLFDSCAARRNWTDRKDNSLFCGEVFTWLDLTIGGIHRPSTEVGDHLSTSQLWKQMEISSGQDRLRWDWDPALSSQCKADLVLAGMIELIWLAVAAVFWI